MVARAWQAPQAGHGQRIEKAIPPSGHWIANAKTLAVITKLGQTGLQERHVTFAGNLVDGHVVEATNIYSGTLRRAPQRINDDAVAVAVLHDVGACQLMRLRHDEAKILTRHDNGGSVLAQEWMMMTESLANVFQLGACLARTEDQRDTFARQCLECRRYSRQRQIAEDRIHVGEHDDRSAWGHLWSRTLTRRRVGLYPVRAVFSALKGGRNLRKRLTRCDVAIRWPSRDAPTVTQRSRDKNGAEARNTRDLQRLSAELINAQEDERRSIARELHDEVGQVLTAIKVELAVAQRTIASRGDSANILEDAQAIADGAIHTVRDLSHLLHPAMLDDLGLSAAIDSYLRGFRRRHGIQAELLHEQMDERLASQIETAGYRIVQEALTNVAKHAKAMSCRVYLQRLARTVLITIEDDGTGFDVLETESAGARKGLGLISMRERVSQLQGTMRIESGPGKGTRVTVELPALSRRVVYEAAEVIHG